MMLEAALNYIAKGFKVFPVKLDKKPYTEHGLKDATQLQVGVKEYWAKWPDAGIGLVTNGLVVLDFDSKHSGLDSKTQMEAKYGPFPRTRTHKTGGGGLHLIYCNLNGTAIRNTVSLGGYQGVDLRGNGGYIIVPPSLHSSGNRYEVIDACEIAPAPTWLLELATKKQPSNTTVLLDCQTIPEGQRNTTLASMAGAMRRKGFSASAIEAALLETNRIQCQTPLSENEIKAISVSVSRYTPEDNGNNIRTCMYNASGQTSTEAKRDKSGTQNGTSSFKNESADLSRFEGLSKRVQSWVESTTGWWETSELDKDLGLTGTKDKENRRKILLRLKDRGLIEAHPKVNKQFRYVDTKVTSLNFKSAATAGIIPVSWPLGIEKYVNLFPGNIAVVAGSPNAGKTALLLNFIHLNQDSLPIFYFCSEMGSIELRDRLDKFPGMSIDDWHFEAFERASDFADVLRPDCINVIDYLEMTTELYTVNTHLTAISHKIGSGLAIVALQKKQGAIYGRGQEFGLEKPKVYLSLDKGKLQIVKGKAWATHNVNPNGLQITFKIINGCQFEATGKWQNSEC